MVQVVGSFIESVGENQRKKRKDNNIIRKYMKSIIVSHILNNIDTNPSHYQRPVLVSSIPSVPCFHNLSQTNM